MIFIDIVKFPFVCVPHLVAGGVVGAIVGLPIGEIDGSSCLAFRFLLPFCVGISPF